MTGNVTAHATSDPAGVLADNLDALGLDRGMLELVAHDGWRSDSSSEWPSIAIESGAGQFNTLHSRRAPIDEARLQLESVRGGDPWPSLVVLLGAGLGYAIDVIEADAPAETRIVVIEPFAACAAGMLARRTWRSLADAGRLAVIVGPTFAGASELWRQIDPRAPAPLVLDQPVIARVRPDALAAAKRVLDRARFDAAANCGARDALGGRYLVNTLLNLPRIVSSRDLRVLKGTGGGAAAVVCGAGPSLSRNLGAVRPVRDRVIVIAVDTAVKPMLEAGVEPDFVVALDPSALNARHLSGLSFSREALLVAEAALDPSAFESFGDRVAFFRVGTNDPWPWLLERGVDVPVLDAWGSVLTSGFALAELLDCDPIVLAGADLAYTDGQPYCRGTAFELDWARIVLQGQQLPVYWRRLAARNATAHPSDIHGQPADSAPHLVAFRDWLGDRAARSGRTIVNLTGAGILNGPAIQQADDEWSWPEAASAPRRTSGWPRADAACRGAVERLSSAGLADLRDDRAPLSAWLESYGRGMDRAMLARALGGAAQACTAAGGAPSFLPRGLVGLPEAVSILRAARDGGPLPEWATESNAWHLRTSDSATAASLVASLLRLPRLEVRGAAGDRLPRVSGHLHLLYALEWPQAVLEAVSALVIETAARLRQAPPARRLALRLPEAAGADDREVTATQADRRARTFVASVWAGGLASRSDASDARTALSLLDAANGALEGPRVTSHATLRVTLRSEASSSAWGIAAPISTATLADALRGALLGPETSRPCVGLCEDGVSLNVAWNSRARDRDVFHRKYLGTMPYRVLTDEGLPKCLMATATAEGTALATPRGQTASYRIGADGSFERTAEWPVPIVGEVHAPRGQFAWSFTTPAVLLFREHATSAVVSAEVSFQTYTGTWWRNRVVLTTSDGLWTWRPGEPPAKLAGVPPAVISDLDEKGLVNIDPLPLVDRRPVRERRSQGWTVELRTGRVTNRRLSPLGQAWTCRRDRWPVSTHTAADAIALEGRAGHRLLLWPCPRTAVWVGRSLVVNTADGHVVQFAGLASRLDEESRS